LVELLLRQRFGALPEWVQERLGQADRAKLERWALRVLSAASLDEVFGPGGGH
jgi:hypothetical protein